MASPRNDLHELAAVRVLQPLYGAYRGLRPAYRPAQHARREGLRFRRLALGWDAAARERWVLSRLRAVVRHAWSGNAYYRQLLDGIGFDPRADFGFDDYARIPVLERAHVRAHSLLVDGFPRLLLRRDSTGGSAGEPTTIWRGPLELGWNESGTEHFMRALGLPPGSSTGLLWGHHLDPVGSDVFRDRARFFLENVRWYDSIRLSPELFDRYHADLSRWRPRCIVAYAGALGAFAEHLDARGVRSPGYPRTAFVTGAEKLLPHHRDAVARVFQRPVHERYGSRDVGLIGFQLQPNTTLAYTIDWANVLVEPESEDPEAPILVTKLHADAMPMLRYRIGDLGRFPPDARPGHPAFTLPAVIGREVDRIWLPDGRWLNGLTLPHMLKDFGVSLFQLVQAEDLSVRVRLVTTPAFGPDQLVEITRLLRANLPGLTITFEQVADIPRTAAHKWRPVISHAQVVPR